MISFVNFSSQLFKKSGFSSSKACNLFSEGAYIRYETVENRLHNAALRQISKLNKTKLRTKARMHQHQVLAEVQEEGSSIGKLVAQSAVSFGLDLIPIAGQIKAAREVYSGIDPITGFKVNRALSALSLIPGGKIASKTLSWMSGTKMAIAGMKLASQSRGLTHAGKGLKVSYDFVKSSKGVIGKHLANGAVGGISSYTGSLATADPHPYRSAAIGFGVGLAFGALPSNNMNKAALYGGGASMASEVFGQGIDNYVSEAKGVNLGKIITKSYVGSLVGSLTYGMPLIAGAIVSWGPSTVFGKLGDELFK